MTSLFLVLGVIKDGPLDEHPNFVLLKVVVTGLMKASGVESPLK